MHADYELVEQAPDVATYRRLRRVNELSEITERQARGALDGSLYWCSVRHRPTGETVAMGRVFGDGGWYFHIADMATDPGHQRMGIGRAVLTELIAFIDSIAPDEPHVTLLADPPGRALYRSMGFEETAPDVIGMRLRRT